MDDAPAADERNLGEQPIARLMDRHELVPHDLVAASTEQITHKMVRRAMKGRRLTPHVMKKILRALNGATGRHYELLDLFDYAAGAGPRGDPPGSEGSGEPAD